jgi:hypothetical protein
MEKKMDMNPNRCGCCDISIVNRYIDTYTPVTMKRRYNHRYGENGVWIRQDIIYVCTDCMLYRKNYANNPWWQIVVPDHIPTKQIDRFAKRLLFGRRGCDKSRNDVLV